jgi:NADPH:quinone reductase-like Zn-dependent oxidoreductase
MTATTLRRKLTGRRIGSYLATHRQEDIQALADMLAAGTIRPVVDRAYPLDRAAEAVAYVESGEARGKVVITI